MKTPNVATVFNGLRRSAHAKEVVRIVVVDLARPLGRLTQHSRLTSLCEQLVGAGKVPRQRI